MTSGHSSSEDADERVRSDLARFVRSARLVVDEGQERFFDPRNDLMRRAARSIIVDVSTACDQFTDQLKADHPDVPWRLIRGMRNRIVHGYAGVDDELVWGVMESALPDLAGQLGIDSVS